MNINPVTLLLLVFFFYPILKGFLFKFSSNNIIEDIEEVIKNVAFILALFIGFFYSKKIFIQHDQGVYRDIYKKIPANFIEYIKDYPIIIYVIIMPLFIFIIYEIIYRIMHLINNITIYLIVDNIERRLKEKSNSLKRLIGALFQVPKACCYILIVVFLLNIFSMFNKNIKINSYLAASSLYNNICEEVVIPVTQSKVAKQLPDIINNSFKIVVIEQNSKENLNNKDNKNIVIYYNGVTLEEGVRSNGQIDNFARNLVKNESATSEKAKTIYYWISKNLEYDQNKANKVLNDDFNVESGAISAFQTQKGICFDYACLYVAMCRANNIKVRLITGEGFNGASWVGHAWNQVYIKEKDAWINVDTTFAKGGNYFDSRRFKMDHKNSRLAGEW